MIKNLLIQNFKCIKEFNQPLGGLTLLTGLNSAGKSSIIQALALLRQSIIDNEWGKALQLNGSLLQLGTMADIINRTQGRHGFSIAIQTDLGRCNWEVTSTDRTKENSAILKEISIKTPQSATSYSQAQLAAVDIHKLVPQGSKNSIDIEFIQSLKNILSTMIYISSERIGPREVYSARTPLSFPDVGSTAEKTALTLEQFEDAGINPALTVPGEVLPLKATVEYWMSQVFPDFKFQIKRLDGADLLIMSIASNSKNDFFRPTHVGFGISHVLPIYTACIAASPGQTILIENPESHLHPAAQSEMGIFLAKAASRGVQIIIETHSDHILNGVRRAVRDKTILSQEVLVYFLSHAREGQESIERILVKDDGKISRWPSGFFDQIDSDLEYLMQEPE